MLIQYYLYSFQCVPWSEFHVWEDQWSEVSPCRCHSHIPTPRPFLRPSGILGIHFPHSRRTVPMPRSLQLQDVREIKQTLVYNAIVYNICTLKRKNDAQYLKCVRLLSALGSVSVSLLSGFQELWGNLKGNTHIWFVTRTSSKAHFTVSWRRASANPVKSSHSTM